jgi:hypothetical protein
MSNSTDLLRRAAGRLRSPLLCNWDRAVAVALADAMDEVAKAVRLSSDIEHRLGYGELITTARALLRSLGHTCPDSHGPCLTCEVATRDEERAR